MIWGMHLEIHQAIVKNEQQLDNDGAKELFLHI